MNKQINTDCEAGNIDFYTRFNELCEYFHDSGESNKVSHEHRWKRNHFIGELRFLLAKACISALQPDLIILDEFQRFKSLLEPKNEFNELAHELFNFSDERSPTKVLLLSATPYKMYTLDHEAGEDNHYEDFIQTIQFLQSSTVKTENFAKLLSQYRHELLRLNKDIAVCSSVRYKKNAGMI
ncbi:hypothetical protein LC613_37525 [Nostoc sphaeroides CHAB 2801]|uniref:hypothetical protein n=1 Tax=Nostoc sphaeroides TaxID=446679 RepID=UPI001E4B7509|nr:hypothetical protein [Nostoc sphaeroides]MCC5633204.1 hypothetical protein [Nostoc sphaeroides CHAB 2801]